MRISKKKENIGLFPSLCPYERWARPEHYRWSHHVALCFRTATWPPNAPPSFRASLQINWLAIWQCGFGCQLFLGARWRSRQPAPADCGPMAYCSPVSSLEGARGTSHWPLEKGCPKPQLTYSPDNLERVPKVIVAQFCHFHHTW